MIDHSKLEMIKGYIEAYNNFDVDGMLMCLDKDIVFENYAGEEINMELAGIAAFSDQAEKAVSLFSERHQEIKGWKVDGNTIQINITYNGKLAKDLPNGLKAGETIKMSGNSKFTFANQKIIKIQDYS